MAALRLEQGLQRYYRNGGQRIEQANKWSTSFIFTDRTTDHPNGQMVQLNDGLDHRQVF